MRSNLTELFEEIADLLQSKRAHNNIPPQIKELNLPLPEKFSKYQIGLINTIQELNSLEAQAPLTEKQMLVREYTLIEFERRIRQGQSFKRANNPGLYK